MTLQQRNNPFLWHFRTGGTNTNTFSPYFTAGYNNQMDGLFGKIAPAHRAGNDPAAIAAAGSLGAGNRWLRKRRNA